eukprot:gene2763-12634_t
MPHRSLHATRHLPTSRLAVTGEGNLRVPRSSAIAYNGHLAADCLGHDMTDASYSSAVNQPSQPSKPSQPGAQ